jgi:isopenicillin N synthase-like dioxygenase
MSLHQIDFTSNNASNDFATSLKNTGFAVLKNHPIDYALVKDVFNEWEHFFSSDYKQSYLFNKDSQDGFFPMTVSETAVGYNIKDLKEFYHYYPWGQYPTELTNKTKVLYQQMNDFAITLLEWVENNLPSSIKDKLTEKLSHMINNSSQTLLRVLHYPPLTGIEEKGAIRANAHTDINLLTILVAASESGLQVQDIKGTWLDVPVDEGMIAINIGDMLQEAADNYYKSTMHRVINPSGDKAQKSRYSIPLFLHPRSDVILSSKYTAGEFLQHRLRELGLKK